MKFLDEYRDGEGAKKIAQEIHRITTKSWTLMEICGGQTHAIVRYGIDELLPSSLTLLHGPGCPVCVTPAELIDQAIELAARPEVILSSFGDMLRVPGADTDLLATKAKGGDVRVVYSPLDALRLAQENPSREVVFFAVGFETTAPANAMTVAQAKAMGVKNFSLLVSQVLVPPAIELILKSPTNRVQGFLAAGHVCTVMGYQEYHRLAEQYRTPMVVTGFEPIDILQGILLSVRQLEGGICKVENQYARVVRPEGNEPAQRVMRDVFEVTDRVWRGIGMIPASGLCLQSTYADFDAVQKFSLASKEVAGNSECIAGLVLQGQKKPPECPAFGTRCNPEHPLGATMVSGEGACAAYFQYRPRGVAP